MGCDPRRRGTVSMHIADCDAGKDSGGMLGESSMVELGKGTEQGKTVFPTCTEIKGKKCK